RRGHARAMLHNRETPLICGKLAPSGVCERVASEIGAVSSVAGVRSDGTKLAIQRARCSLLTRSCVRMASPFAENTSTGGLTPLPSSTLKLLQQLSLVDFLFPPSFLYLLCFLPVTGRIPTDKDRACRFAS